MSDIVAIASVGVSIDLTALDDGCAIGISISFRIDIVLFEGLPGSYNYKPSRNYDLNSAKQYMKSCMVKLKKIYEDWESYLQLCQRELQGVVFGSMDDVTAHASKIIIRRNDFVNEIENLIVEIDNEMKKYKNSDGKTKELFLIMLSNCYQAIRDLTVTFNIGEHPLEIDVLMLEELETIRDRYLSNSYYSNMEIMKKIVKRREISERIINSKKSIWQNMIFVTDTSCIIC